MRGRGWWLGVMLLTAGCGGRSQRTSADPSETGGSNDGTMGGSSQSASGANGVDDSAAGALEPGAAGAPSEAGAPDTSYQSLIRSGTRRCVSNDYCFGLSCYAPADFGPTVCVAPCQSDANCGLSEACLSAPRLEATCYARCKSPEDCYYGFACYDFSGEGELVCFPAPWALNRDKLGY